MQWHTYVLYCHVSPQSQDDILAAAEGIRNLLKARDGCEEGLLVLFVDTGLQDLLRMIHPIRRPASRALAKEAKQKLKEELLSRSGNLRSGEEMGRALEAKLGDNVRALTALDLVDIFAEMSAVEDLKKYLIGPEGQIRYDTPKFVESIVRLRMIGSRVPVLRLDQDVLIPSRGERYPEDALRLAITDIRNAVVAHHDRTQVLATILSASYVTPERDSRDATAWSRGYATRLLPCLLVPDEATAAEHLKALREGGDVNWRDELQRHFDRELAQRFFDGLWEWGGPTTGVISGALLYMNDAVVLNVPPFSNFSQKVMWIDDHLRYVLHREMGDFCRQTQTTPRNDRPLHVHYSSAQVPKHRLAASFLVYTVKDYLPSLLWGSFVDYWLCESPLLKRRQEHVGREGSPDAEQWRVERLEGRPGILTTAVRDARAGCHPDEGALRDDLRRAAQKRLDLVRDRWGSLQESGRQALASAWVHGQLPDCLRNYLYDAREEERIAPKLPETVEGFDDALRDGFNNLLDDACRYVKWVSDWPRVVSVIRAIPPGEFRSDLEWQPRPGQ